MVGRWIFVAVTGIAACSSTTSRVTDVGDASAGASAGGKGGEAAGGDASGGMAGAASSSGGNGGTSAGGSSGSAGAGGGQAGEPGEQIPMKGLVLWFDAQRDVEAANGAVASWTSQAGNGIEATQGVESYRPMLIDSDGRPALEFEVSTTCSNCRLASPISAPA